VKLFYYICKRLIYLAPVLLGVVVVTFVVGRVLPGDPVHLALGQEVDKELITQVMKEMGLDKPIIEQFRLYVVNLLHGDLGTSWHTRNPVTYDIAQRLPATVELALAGLLLCVLVAIPIGIIAAVRKDTWADHVCRMVSLVGMSMPSFWLGLLLIFFLYFKLDIFPPPFGRSPIGFVVTRVTGLYTVDTLLAGNFMGFLTVLRYLSLPAITLALIELAPVTRLTRSSMIEALQSDYILAARASGIPERTVQYKLALKNAIIPPLTTLGMVLGRLFGGTVIVEKIFSWPGLGQWSINAAQSADYAPIQAFALLAAFIRVIIFLLLDLAYFALDPRIRQR
jgi:peptide/nickel transport system permease protein